jgi:hypothetical protein
MNDWVIVDALDRAELPAAIYRTGRRLLDLTQPGDLYVRVGYSQMETICDTTSQNTVRGHLVALANAGIITYRRNDAIHIMWHDGSDAIAGRSKRSQHDQKDRSTISEEDVDGEPETGPRSQGDQIDRSTREKIAGRSKRSQGDHPLGIGREGIDLDPNPGIDPNQPTHPNPEGGVGETDAERSVALLTDPEVGVSEQRARQLALRFTLAAIREQVFQFLRDRQAGRVHSPGVIGTRLERGYAPGRIQESDRASPVWERHWTEEDEAEDIRRRYIPDEYKDIIRS